MNEVKDKGATWIKVYRSLLDWEWYEDINTKVLFIHLLLIVNIKPQRKQGLEIPVGSIDRTYEQLCKETNLSKMQLRTALNKLKDSGEITVKKVGKFSVFTVVAWGKFQSNNTKITQKYHKDNTSITLDQHKDNTLNKNIKNNKEYKEEKEISSNEQDDDDLPTLSFTEAQAWEKENGKKWEGWIQF